MNVLDNPFEKDHLAASRKENRNLFRSANQVDRAKPAYIGAERPRVRLTFLEDFTLEHSFPGIYITSVEISG